jgi:hypothetical protein
MGWFSYRRTVAYLDLFTGSFWIYITLHSKGFLFMKYFVNALYFVLIALFPISVHCQEKDINALETAIDDCASFVTSANYTHLESAWREISIQESSAIQERLYVHRKFPLTITALISILDEKTIIENGFGIEPFTASDCSLSLVDPENLPLRFRSRRLNLQAFWGGERIENGRLEEVASRWLSKRAAALTRIGPENDSEGAFVDCEKSNPEFISIDLAVKENNSRSSKWNLEIRTIFPWDRGRFCSASSEK